MPSGVWLDSAPSEHACRLPVLWPFHIRTGDRWKCRCGRVWRVVTDDNGRMWSPEDKAVDAELKVFRPVTDEQLEYWLNHELGVPLDHPLEPRTVVEAIRKHFEIGSRA